MNFQIYHIRWKEESRYTRSKVFHYFKLNRRIFKSTNSFLILFQYFLLMLHCEGKYIEVSSTQKLCIFFQLYTKCICHQTRIPKLTIRYLQKVDNFQQLLSLSEMAKQYAAALGRCWCWVNI